MVFFCKNGLSIPYGYYYLWVQILAGINFSDFAITWSIYSKMFSELILAGKIVFFLPKMGQFANFAKLSTRKQ